MNRKKLAKVHMKGQFIPSFILVILGIVHMKLNLIDNEGDEFYITKSPYLMKMQHWFGEYVNKMRIKLGELIEPVRHNLLEYESQKRILINRREVIEQKRLTLPEKPSVGIQIRACISLEKQKNINEEAITAVEAEIEKCSKEIQELRDQAAYCMDRVKENSLAKAYAYVEGVQKACRSNGFYIQAEDYKCHLFQYLTDNALAAKEARI